MKAMVLKKVKSPLVLEQVPNPIPSNDEVLIKIQACAICRTDLHIFDGELPNPKIPLILGHQIVGTVIGLGKNVTKFQIGERVGVPWLGYTCGTCQYCKKNQENICENPIYTGYTKDGGLAEFCTAHAEFCLKLPSQYESENLAPLLCGGLIGYRALRFTTGENIGFYGFGSSAHILLQVAKKAHKNIFVFTKPNDTQAQNLSIQLGAMWAGSSDQTPPKQLDSAIIFAPVGELIPKALKDIIKGGSVVCAGIHMSLIPSFSYDLLWGERILRSVTNLTRQDGKEFMSLAEKIDMQTKINVYSLEKANQALSDLKNGNITGSVVIKIS